MWSLGQTGTELLRFSAVLALQLSLGSGTGGSHPRWQLLAHFSIPPPPPGGRAPRHREGQGEAVAAHLLDCWC